MKKMDFIVKPVWQGIPRIRNNGKSVSMLQGSPRIPGGLQKICPLYILLNSVLLHVFHWHILDPVFQVWQWARHAAQTVDGTMITPSLVRDTVAKAVFSLAGGCTAGGSGGERHRFKLAGHLVEQMMTAPELDDFLTLVAYPHILSVANCRL